MRTCPSGGSNQEAEFLVQGRPPGSAYGLLNSRKLGRRALLQSATLWLLSGAVGTQTLRVIETAEGAATPQLRIGLLTDLHYADRPAVGTRFYRETFAKLRECVNQFNTLPPDFVVELGDFIDAADTADEELGFLKTVDGEFTRLNSPRHYVLGNHCVWTLTKAQFQSHCGARRPFYSFDHGAFHFVVLDACYRADGVSYGARNFVWTDTEIPPEERDWLKDDLQAAQGQAIVFVHQRLDVQNEFGVKSASTVREILERSGKVVAVIQGHFHQNDYREIHGIHYCTLAAMIEGSGPENNAYALLSLFRDGTVKLDGFRLQKSYRLPHVR